MHILYNFTKKLYAPLHTRNNFTKKKLCTLYAIGIIVGVHIL